MEDQRKFINYISNHYNELFYKYRQFCNEKGYDFSPDIFQDTILKCYEAIEKKGKLNDTSSYGIESYFFISFKLNIKREGMYARNMKRDLNITSDNIGTIYEEWYNDTHDSSHVKLINDLYKDFATLYIIKTVEDTFDQEHFNLFRWKYLIPEMTYKKLQEKTKAKKCRQKVVEVKTWIQQNVSKNDIKDAFMLVYGDLL